MESGKGPPKTDLLISDQNASNWDCWALASAEAQGRDSRGQSQHSGEVLARTSEPRLPGVATASPTPAEALGACCRRLGEAVYLQEPF